ncbi:hypothetical protein RMATCC62417_08336 [Rhizopus microsporus]|nr:hypothetical protein RMATCC62417_08336 [Rhizopus microsporus]
MFTITDDIIDHTTKILIEESKAITKTAERLKSNADTKEGYYQAIYLMFKALDAGGKIVVTGVGKSGKIGEKIVATMLSTGTSATFLHPVEALHGDLGVVQPNDVVLALSFSGNTEELLILLPSLKHRSIPVIGLGGNPSSKLAKECAAWIDGYVQSEAGGSLPAPTCSTTVALALGDAIALTLAKLCGFTTDGFALNHPGGSLGRRLLLKVSDVCIDPVKVACVTPESSLNIVIMEMTKYPQSSGVIVLAEDEEEEERLPEEMSDSFYPSPPLSAASSVIEDSRPSKITGIVTHDDIHRILKSKESRNDIFDICAADIMTPNPFVFNEDALASEAYTYMLKHNIPLLPIVSKSNGWTGIVTLKDLQELF